MTSPEEFFVDNELGKQAYRRVAEILVDFPGMEIRVTRSQIAFRRKRGFAYLWAPTQWLKNPDAEVVLSIALGRAARSDRWKEVAHPTEKHWIHHLEIDDIGDIDSEVVEWLREAAERAT